MVREEIKRGKSTGKKNPNIKNLSINICLREGWMIPEHSLSLKKAKDKAAKEGD